MAVSNANLTNLESLASRVAGSRNARVCGYRGKCDSGRRLEQKVTSRSIRRHGYLPPDFRIGQVQVSLFVFVDDSSNHEHIARIESVYRLLRKKQMSLKESLMPSWILPRLVVLVGHCVLFIAPGGSAERDDITLPQWGVCAHRGASATHPENTVAALLEAVRLGAQMVEIDLALSRDRQIVLMHDATVDRTTNGHGRVEDLSLSELQELDAGAWKSPQFRGERVPTFHEALAVLPMNIWINVHLKGDEELAREAARQLATNRRLQQSFLACDQKSAAAARDVVADIAICNMDRLLTSEQYVRATIDSRAKFIQFLGSRPTALDQIGLLDEHQIRVNYCCCNSPEKLLELFDAGVDFVLVDSLEEMLRAAEQGGVERLKPVKRDKQ